MSRQPPYFVFARRTGIQPGANAFAWMEQHAPIQSPIGSGMIVGEYQAFQAPEVFWPYAAVWPGGVAPFYMPPAGLGGVIAGTAYYSGPPFDPNAQPTWQTQQILQPTNGTLANG